MEYTHCSNVVFIEGSILDEEVLKRAFSERLDFIFHLAAHFANQNSVDNPETDLMVNGLGTQMVLQYSHLTRVGKFVFASSGCSVYGSQAPLPLKEDFVSLHLDTPYQITKLLGELYCNFFYNHYGLPVAIARYFNVFVDSATKNTTTVLLGIRRDICSSTNKANLEGGSSPDNHYPSRLNYILFWINGSKYLIN